MGHGDEHTVASSADKVRDDVDSWPTGRRLSTAARLLESRFDRFLAGQDLTHAGLIVLHHISAGPLSQRELAGLCRVTDQTISRTVDRLSRAAHVARTTDELDRRRTTVAITPEGITALAAARIEERKSEHLFGALDDYDHFRDQLITLIEIATRPEPS